MTDAPPPAPKPKLGLGAQITDFVTNMDARAWRADPAAFARVLGDSSARFGFAIVRDHGLDAGMVARALEATKAFFALPEDVKRRYWIEGGAGQRGYIPFGKEAATSEDKVDHTN